MDDMALKLTHFKQKQDEHKKSLKARGIPALFNIQLSDKMMSRLAPNSKNELQETPSKLEQSEKKPEEDKKQEETECPQTQNLGRWSFEKSKGKEDAPKQQFIGVSPEDLGPNKTELCNMLSFNGQTFSMIRLIGIRSILNSY
mmetsp:Transcript_21908/g.34037  ORF Transcript_21908/g.34037 Transcript_21908/m.34037 type:complete len:143 (+) Transcript_21908:140-568(+)